MKPLSVEIVPAHPGFYTIINFRETQEVAIGEPIIAWRIETHNVKGREDLFSICIPITVDGDAISDCIGVQNPDLTVTVFEDSTYPSLQELREHRYPKG